MFDEYELKKLEEWLYDQSMHDKVINRMQIDSGKFDVVPWR
jgi:hypothetical protein